MMQIHNNVQDLTGLSNQYQHPSYYYWPQYPTTMIQCPKCGYCPQCGQQKPSVAPESK